MSSVRVITKATLSKRELMIYLGIGEIKLNKLLMNSGFPKQKPILNKWSRAEIDNWLNRSLDNIAVISEDLNWSDFFRNE